MRHIATKERINQGHHAVTTVLNTEVAADNLEHHHQGDTKVRSMEEPEGLGLPPKHMTMKTTKKRWGHKVRTTPVPKGFKLPHDQKKYDGSQDPQLWLSDYL
jgi:hypothetical protein